LAGSARPRDARRVTYLYSLYDALVSINVPSDKARAVIDAMERDMGTTLATKQDLEAQSLVTKKDLEVLKMEMKLDLQLLQKEMENRFTLVDQRFSSLESRMSVKLGSMFIAGIGLLVAMRYWA
jgi:hypothetical protein